MPNATLLLGSNLGDSKSYIDKACQAIACQVGTIVKSTPIIQSDAWGYISKNVYSNQIVVVETALCPLPLLDSLLAIETELGRTRPLDAAIRYADRTIDIDILYYDNVELAHPRLTIPHPRIAERPFVQTLLDALKL